MPEAGLHPAADTPGMSTAPGLCVQRQNVPGMWHRYLFRGQHRSPESVPQRLPVSRILRKLELFVNVLNFLRYLHFPQRNEFKDILFRFQTLDFTNQTESFHSKSEGIDNFGCVSIVRQLDSPTPLNIKFRKKMTIKYMLTLFESIHAVCISMFPPLIWGKIKEI